MPKLELTSQQRSALRAAAHPLHPVVLIGDRGLTAAVLEEIDRTLAAHELIKIRVAGAELNNGLLHVDLVREIPEAMKPRTVAINANTPAKALSQAA